ncbi:hypothetical protein [Actinomadura sp. NBRC 104425]|uniref:hypothetical protein n=1 Tax=Actinomadura sp. NBRC 104425 TaxID=3032204 RepID=UPI002554048D|nr:hypothetical protein [Actinomadura sp. NBRC 104425]
MPHTRKPRNMQPPAARSRCRHRGTVSSSWHECPVCGRAYDDPADADRCCR